MANWDSVRNGRKGGEKKAKETTFFALGGFALDAFRPRRIENPLENERRASVFRIGTAFLKNGHSGPRPFSEWRARKRGEKKANETACFALGGFSPDMFRPQKVEEKPAENEQRDPVFRIRPAPVATRDSFLKKWPVRLFGGLRNG